MVITYPHTYIQIHSCIGSCTLPSFFLKCRPNKNGLSLLLKVSTVGESRMSQGRPFHSFGPQAPNARSPYNSRVGLAGRVEDSVIWNV